MKIQIRRGVFETNSSSTHSLVITTQDEYDKWKNGEVYFDKNNNSFITEDELIKYTKESRWIDTDGKTEEEIIEAALEDSEFYTYSGYEDYCSYNYYELYEEFTSPSGDNIIIFGYYGYDG